MQTWSGHLLHLSVMQNLKTKTWTCVKNILKNIGLTLLTIIISFFVFIMFLNIMRYPGGAVGMIPIVLLYSAVISLIPTIILIGLLRIKRIVKINEAILIFLLGYILISYFYIEVRPFDRDNSEMDKNVDLWIYLSEIIACGLIITFNKIKETLHNKT